MKNVHKTLSNLFLLLIKIRVYLGSYFTNSPISMFAYNILSQVDRKEFEKVISYIEHGKREGLLH